MYIRTARRSVAARSLVVQTTPSGINIHCALTKYRFNVIISVHLQRIQSRWLRGGKMKWTAGPGLVEVTTGRDSHREPAHTETFIASPHPTHHHSPHPPPHHQNHVDRSSAHLKALQHSSRTKRGPPHLCFYCLQRVSPAAELAVTVFDGRSDMPAETKTVFFS